MYHDFIGIDISKKDFSVALYANNENKVYLNEQKGFAAFFVDYQNILKTGLVVLETTGGYEMPLIHYLQAHQCAVHRANTRKVKFFIRSYGRMAKTDAIDAHGLALYGKERQDTLELFQVNLHQKLVKLVQRRIELKQMLVQEKNRKQAPDAQGLQSSFNAIISAIETELKVLEKEIDEIFQQDTMLREKKKVLKSVKGIGDIIATELLALLPELGTTNRRKIASLAGVAPHPNQSGRKVGYRATKGGREGIKPILFMAAMTACRSKSKFGEFYERLVLAGKKKMVALTALMRKIVITANAKLRDFMALNKIPQHS